ncbi:MAG: YabP/YqfC family sporulation protein [Oscillospiraceae bacterium]|jgi:sporulation protein YabP|nr:YabP/YqfC family sporulation protein [Oscillospiraceae bacterium]
MERTDLKQQQWSSHAVSLVGRRKLVVSSVDDIESFDEQLIVLHTSAGVLIIRGSALKIEKLSTDGGELSVSGKVDAMDYEDESVKSGLFARLFK